MRQLYTGQIARFASLVLCVLWLLAGERDAWCQSAQHSADQGDQTDCLNDPKCSELYENARRLSQAGQYEAALVTYQSAYAQKPSPWLLINIGRMQQKAGRPQQAVRTLKRFLDDPLAKGDEESQTKARDYLQQAEEEARAPQQRLEVTQSSASKEKAPIYKKWWFWTAVGGATAAVAVGLGVGLTARFPASPSVPQGVSVYDTGF